MIGWRPSPTVTYSVVMNRRKTSRSSAGRVLVTTENYRSSRVAGLARQHDPPRLALAHHPRQDRRRLPPPRRRQRLLGAAEGEQRLELLDRREDQLQIPGAMGVERGRRLEPAGVVGLVAVRPRRRVGRGESEEEPGV